MKKNIYIMIAMMMLLTVTTSCHDELDTVPLSTLAPENFFNTMEESEIAVNGVYDALADAYKQNYIYMSDHGSHVATIVLNNRNLNMYAYYTYDNANRFVTDTWKDSYKTIYRANVVINRLSKIESQDPKKNRIIGEAKFIRALSYFNLVRFYGDVPLVLDELLDFEDSNNVNSTRTSSAVVYDAIIADLKFAETHLYTASWVSDLTKLSYEGGNQGRATAGAAKGLLAKVYLTRASYPERDQASYQLAFEKANELINEGHYSLESDYFNVNTLEGKSSQEWLFQVQYNVLAEQTSNWGGLHNPLNQGGGGRDANDWGYGRVSPTLKFAQSFEDGDPRAESIAKGKINADGSIKYNKNSKVWYSHKYRFSSRPLSRFNTDMNAPVLRYADILLIHAEAAAELGYDGDAHDSLDKILTRAQNGGTVPALVNRGLSSDELREFVFWERARELCFEGHGKLDIMRSGLDKFMAEVKGQLWTPDETKESKSQVVPWSDNVQPYHLLFPIPAAEMAANPNMTQNEGY